MLKVEPDCLRFAFSEGERGGCLVRVGEAVQLCEAEGAMGVGDIAEDTAGADRGKLLIITDQPDTRTATDGELDGRVEGEGVGHAGFVDDHQCRRADRGWPVGQWPCRNDQVSLARVSARIPVCSPRTAAAAADGARPSS